MCVVRSLSNFPFPYLLTTRVMEEIFPYGTLLKEMQGEIRSQCGDVERFFLGMTCRREWSGSRASAWEMASRKNYNIVFNQCIMDGWTTLLRGFALAHTADTFWALDGESLLVPFTRGDMPMVRIPPPGLFKERLRRRRVNCHLT